MGTGSRQTRERQADKLYQYVYGYLMKNARPPSQREMLAGIKCSSTRLKTILAILVAQGRAIHRPLRHRQTWPRVEGGLRDEIELSALMDPFTP